MIVVSDTTPLISFLKIGHIDLLEKLFGKVFIPQAVYNELTADIRFQHEAQQIEQSTFIEVRAVENTGSVSVLKRATGLDQGESEAKECIDILQRTGRHISQKHYQMLLDMLSERPVRQRKQ